MMLRDGLGLHESVQVHFIDEAVSTHHEFLSGWRRSVRRLRDGIKARSSAQSLNSFMVKLLFDMGLVPINAIYRYLTKNAFSPK